MSKLDFLLFWAIALLPYYSFAQTQEFYAEIELSVDQLPQLIENGLFLDHIHKTASGHIAMVVDQSEI